MAEVNFDFIAGLASVIYPETGEHVRKMILDEIMSGVKDMQRQIDALRKEAEDLNKRVEILRRHPPVVFQTEEPRKKYSISVSANSDRKIHAIKALKVAVPMSVTDAKRLVNGEVLNFDLTREEVLRLDKLGDEWAQGISCVQTNLI